MLETAVIVVIVIWAWRKFDKFLREDDTEVFGNVVRDPKGKKIKAGKEVSTQLTNLQHLIEEFGPSVAAVKWQERKDKLEASGKFQDKLMLQAMELAEQAHEAGFAANGAVQEVLNMFRGNNRELIAELKRMNDLKEQELNQSK